MLAACSYAFLAITVNVLAAALALSAIAFYVFVYTMWLKRSTDQNIVIGGAAGAVPVLVGWAAVDRLPCAAGDRAVRGGDTAASQQKTTANSTIAGSAREPVTAAQPTSTGTAPAAPPSREPGRCERLSHMV